MMAKKTASIARLPGTSGAYKELYQIESDSRPGAFYVTARKADGAWGCSCPAWCFHTPRRDCKHIQAVKARLSGAAVPVVGKDVALPDSVKKAISRFALLDAE
jgi:hypothetical protein